MLFTVPDIFNIICEFLELDDIIKLYKVRKIPAEFRKPFNKLFKHLKYYKAYIENNFELLENVEFENYLIQKTKYIKGYSLFCIYLKELEYIYKISKILTEASNYLMSRFRIPFENIQKIFGLLIGHYKVIRTLRTISFENAVRYCGLTAYLQFYSIFPDFIKSDEPEKKEKFMNTVMSIYIFNDYAVEKLKKVYNWEIITIMYILSAHLDNFQITTAMEDSFTILGVI